MANGIPALLNSVANVANDAVLLVADAEIVLSMFAPPQWGIFNQDGSIAIQPDSMISLDFKREWRIPNYPQEQGAFQSYNKVATPSDTRIRLSKGGTAAVRGAFLAQVSAAAASLNLYNVKMPEGTHILNVNFTSYAISRTQSSGVGLILIDLELEEIRVTATTAFTNTAAPSGANSQSTGTVQPQTPTTAQSAAASLIQ
jgi:hypothetical protein